MPILVNKHPVHCFTFAGGEVHVDVSEHALGAHTEITALLYRAEDVIQLLMVVDAVRRQRDTAIHLIIPYMPYARQDRVCNPGEALGVRVMADVINALGCARVTIADPHSDVAPALIDRCHVIHQADILVTNPMAEQWQAENRALVAPDAGAEKKARMAAKRLGLDLYCATKIRDTRTGAITDTRFHDDVRGRKLLIVDDICDGGRTFVELAALLRGRGADDIRLYITHGIFSRGLDALRPHISHVYCGWTFLAEEDRAPGFLTLLAV